MRVLSSLLLPLNPTPSFPKPYSNSNNNNNNNKLSPAKTFSSSSSSSRSPLLMNVRRDHKKRLNYYGDLASKLAEEQKLDDFVMIAESVLIEDHSTFLASLDIKRVSAGLSKVIRGEGGGIESVVKVLRRIEKLGIRPSSLFDCSAREALAMECRRILKRGRMKEFVDLAETLAGLRFSVKELVEPMKLIKKCVHKRDPKMAVRYASILPNAHILYCSIIHEFGKKWNLESALIAFEMSKCKSVRPNMYVYRTMIDVCGHCGDPLKARYIYEAFPQKKKLSSEEGKLKQTTLQIKQKEAKLIKAIEAKALYEASVETNARVDNGVGETCDEITPEIVHINGVFVFSLNDAQIDGVSNSETKLIDAQIERVNNSIPDCNFGENQLLHDNCLNKYPSKNSTAMEVDACELSEDDYRSKVVAGDDVITELDFDSAGDGLKSSDDDFFYGPRVGPSGENASLLSKRVEQEVELLAQKDTPNTYVFNSLMNVNSHDLSYIFHVYKHMRNLGVTADMTSYNVLLKACCLAGRVDLAQDIYNDVRHRASTGKLDLDVITYSTIIKVFADARMWQMALKIKEDMILAGVSPNIVTWSSLISAYANAGLVEQAIRVFEEMLLAGCEPNSQCRNILLDACVEACQYDRAFRIFRAWKENPFPRSIAENSRGNDVTSLQSCDSDPHHISFTKMVPFIPTTATYNILLKACGTDYYRAKSLMDEMKINGLTPDQRSWSILIDICGGAGNVGGAITGLTTMRDAGIKPDVVAYTTAIKACVKNRSLKKAFSLFEEMKRHQLQPNLVTYNTLLRACSRYGSLHEVQQCLAIYQDMRKAGYNPNDYFLKELIEEWCEEVIQGHKKNQDILGLCDSRNNSNAEKTQSLLLEKVAAHLQKDSKKSLSIDIRALTKVEARIVVLAALRMIKESYTIGNHIKDDMVIILGITKEGTGIANQESDVQDAIIKLLRDELELDVVLIGPRLPLTNSYTGRLPDSNLDLENQGGNNKLITESMVRRPAVLRRLKITRKSLHQWLQKRIIITRRL
ncbi:hypothetical protein GIB67_030332 [Kingdonia uniflora]|uniref:Pentatricopeptide repeat-containing protein n=1 Tax=Kingdonia uniflora TaxID=39325 RepID=A0A7J7M6K7_9MAGN|nr:hypothetical protein GIB67_030332 [Kingdonia uniflora]